MASWRRKTISNTEIILSNVPCVVRSGATAAFGRKLQRTDWALNFSSCDVGVCPAESPLTQFQPLRLTTLGHLLLQRAELRTVVKKRWLKE